MDPLLIFMAGFWFVVSTSVVDSAYYDVVNFNDLAFDDNVVFNYGNAEIASPLSCATRCKQSGSCVTFTFHPQFCRGHASCVTSTTAATATPGAITFAYEGAGCGPILPIENHLICDGTGVKHVIDLEIGIDAIFDCDDDWIVFQRRVDGSVDFYRNWANYTVGFGDPYGNYWLGLENVHRITSSQAYDLQVDLFKWDGTNGSSVYTGFTIGSADTNYTMDYVDYIDYGTGNGMSYHKGMMFTTYDADNDLHATSNVAEMFRSAWWYAGSYVSNLNGNYNNTANKGITWGSFAPYSVSMKFAQMKLRPGAIP